MSVRVEVWIDCDVADCANEIGPMLTETTARNVARAARWLPLKHLRDGRQVDAWWCPSCRKAPPSL